MVVTTQSIVGCAHIVAICSGSQTSSTLCVFILFFLLPGNVNWDGKLEDSTQTFGISGFQEPQTVCLRSENPGFLCQRGSFFYIKGR